MIELAADWQRFRAQVRHAGNALSPQIFEQAASIFLDAYCGGETPAGLTREWEREEFLLVVDENGSPCLANHAMMEAYAKIIGRHPGFVRWFQAAVWQAEGTQDGSGQQVLMANRWLCHLVGLRHLTVEIFIDPPGLSRHTLVQVRGMDKFEAPGCFDIPCAGHISGLDGVEASLRKELGEELNLTLEDLEEVRLVNQYDSRSEAQAGARNNEYRYLYRGTLRAGSIAKVAFADGEVAGLCVMAVGELQTLVERFPERIASGLSGAMPFYR